MEKKKNYKICSVENHNSPNSFICLEQSCQKKGPFCGLCLFIDHKEHINNCVLIDKIGTSGKIEEEKKSHAILGTKEEIERNLSNFSCSISSKIKDLETMSKEIDPGPQKSLNDSQLQQIRNLEFQSDEEKDSLIAQFSKSLILNPSNQKE